MLPAVVVALLLLLIVTAGCAQQPPPPDRVGNSAACGSCKELRRNRKDACEEGGCTTCTTKVNKRFVPMCKNPNDTDCCVGHKGGTIVLPSGTKKRIEKISKTHGKPTDRRKVAFDQVLSSVHQDLKGSKLKKKQRNAIKKALGVDTHCALVRQGSAEGFLTDERKVAFDLKSACTAALEPVQSLTSEAQQVARGAYGAVGGFGKGKGRTMVRMEGMCYFPQPAALSCERAKGLGVSRAARPSRPGLGSKEKTVSCDLLKDIDDLPSAVAAACD